MGLEGLFPLVSRKEEGNMEEKKKSGTWRRVLRHSRLLHFSLLSLLLTLTAPSSPSFSNSGSELEEDH